MENTTFNTKRCYNEIKDTVYMLMIKPSDTVRTDLDLTKKQKTTRIQEKKIYKQTD